MFKIIFSDIDGTLAFYEKQFKEFAKIISKNKNTVLYQDTKTQELRECRILPSKTFGDAYISEKSYELIQKIRAQGIVFCLTSGARQSTLLDRMTLLPTVDSYMGENGCLIYENGGLDVDWIRQFSNVTGSMQSEIPPEKRQGLIWDLFRKLQADHWYVDARGYLLTFRLDLKKTVGKREVDLEKIIKNLPNGITSAMNLGKVDFFPKVAGKGQAAKYVMNKKGIDRQESVALIDDDNDLPLADSVGQVMLPGITHQAVTIAVKKHPEWYTSKAKGILGIEEILERILKV